MSISSKRNNMSLWSKQNLWAFGLGKTCEHLLQVALRPSNICEHLFQAKHVSIDSICSKLNMLPFVQCKTHDQMFQAKHEHLFPVKQWISAKPDSIYAASGFITTGTLPCYIQVGEGTCINHVRSFAKFDKIVHIR